MSTEHTLLKFDSRNGTGQKTELCVIEDGGNFDVNFYQMNGDSLSSIHKLGRKSPAELEKLAIRILQVASYADPELDLKSKYNIGDEELIWSTRPA